MFAADHVAGEQIDGDDFDFLRGFIDRLTERRKLRGRDYDRGRVRCKSALEQADLTVDIGLGLGAKLHNIGTEVPASFTRARQLPSDALG